MRIKTVAFTISVSFAPVIVSAQATSEDICNLAPQVMQLVEPLQGIPDVFDDILLKMDSSSRAQFDKVAEIDDDLARVAAEYRKAFLDACF